MTTLLLGMGNPILCDDAIGVRLASDFARRLEGREGLRVEPDCAVGGLNLLDVLAGYSRAIVLDALHVAQAVPGRWHAFDAAALRETMNLTNVHDANFATSLELGRRLGMALPDPSAIHVFAVEVTDVHTFSERMTPELERGYPVLAEEIFRAVEVLLGERG